MIRTYDTGAARPKLREPVAALALGLTMALGQGCATSTAPLKAAAPALPDDVLQPLRAMGDALRSARSMRFTSKSTMDEALESGQLVQISRHCSYDVRRPDGLRVHIGGDDATWALWYDGGRFTVLDRATDEFAMADVPPTLDAFFDEAFNEHGVSIPMSDLLYSDARSGLLKNVHAARHLGMEDLNGQPCHHLGFRQENIDWQLWVDAGDMAVPRKLIITYKLEPGMPQYVSILQDWELDPEIPDSEFMAKVPQDKRAMTFKEFLGAEEEESHEDR